MSLINFSSFVIILICAISSIICNENNEFELNIRYIIENSRNRIFNNFGKIKYSNEIISKKSKSKISNFEFALNDKEILKNISKECSKNSNTHVIFEINKTDNFRVFSSLKAVRFFNFSVI